MDIHIPFPHVHHRHGVIRCPRGLENIAGRDVCILLVVCLMGIGGFDEYRVLGAPNMMEWFWVSSISIVLFGATLDILAPHNEVDFFKDSIIVVLFMSVGRLVSEFRIVGG